MAEIVIEDELQIDAPPSTVWAAIKDPVAHAAWHPFVTVIAGEHSHGASRSCSVVVGTTSGLTHERCIEEEAERRIIWLIEHDSTGFGRMVSDWRAGFRLEPAGPGTRVVAESRFRPDGMLVRLTIPIVRRKFHQTQKAILAGLRDALLRE